MMETKEQKNESRTKEKKPLTEQQRQQRQKMLVYPLMVLLFAGCMWLIFAPSSEDKEKERQGQGFNTDMPMPEDSKIIGDKAKAYEQQDLENKRKERRGMVGDLSAFWNDSDGRCRHFGRLPPDTDGNDRRGNGGRKTGGHPHFRCRLPTAEHLAGHVLRAAEGGHGKGGTPGAHRRTGSHAGGAG